MEDQLIVLSNPKSKIQNRIRFWELTDLAHVLNQVQLKNSRFLIRKTAVLDLGKV